MKKSTAVLMAVALSLTLVLSGCGEDEEETTSSSSSFSSSSKSYYSSRISSSSSSEEEKKTVENAEVTVTFQHNEYKGTYTGDVNSRDLPDGEGKFSYAADAEGKYLNYEGEFSKGEFSDSGTLDTNNYTIVFTVLNDEGEEEEVERTGTYQGAVDDGEASGEGVYKAVNGNGNAYTYTGEFKRGTFNGQGQRVFDDASLNYAPETGNFANGDFSPTYAEGYAYLGYDTDPEHASEEYEVNEATKNALDAAEAAEKPSYVENNTDSSVTYDAFKENPDACYGKIVSWTFTIQNSGGFASDNYFVNHGFMDLPGKNDSGQWITAFVFTGADEAESKLEDVPPGSNITVYGIPIANTSFESVDDEGNFTGEECSTIVLAGLKYVVNQTH